MDCVRLNPASELLTWNHIQWTVIQEQYSLLWEPQSVMVMNSAIFYNTQAT